MLEVKTRLGYSFWVEDEDTEIGDLIELTSVHDEEGTVPIDSRDLVFLGQAFGAQRPIASILRDKYDLKEGIRVMPDYLLNLPLEQLKEFMVRFISANSHLVYHKSGTPGNLSCPEVYFTVLDERLARQLQEQLLRLNIKLRVRRHPTRQTWNALTCGQQAYINIRQLVMDTKVPKLVKQVRRLDKLLSFGMKVGGTQKLTDKIIEIYSEDGELLA